MTLSWARPDAHGAAVTHYNVDWGVGSIVATEGSETSHTLSDLKPDTSYSVRLQGVNAHGVGAFGPAIRLSTRPLPPAPPRLECVNANHNSLKLKWGDSKSVAATASSSSGDAGVLASYCLDMENSRGQFQTVYNGTGVSHKINKLGENSRYRFRISAANEAGQGPTSQVFEFKTAYAHPPPVKSKSIIISSAIEGWHSQRLHTFFPAPPRVTSITSDGCLVEWNAVKFTPTPSSGSGAASSAAADPVLYKVQLSKNRDLESKMVRIHLSRLTTLIKTMSLTSSPTPEATFSGASTAWTRAPSTPSRWLR